MHIHTVKSAVFSRYTIACCHQYMCGGRSHLGTLEQKTIVFLQLGIDFSFGDATLPVMEAFAMPFKVIDVVVFTRSSNIEQRKCIFQNYKPGAVKSCWTWIPYRFQYWVLLDSFVYHFYA